MLVNVVRNSQSKCSRRIGVMPSPTSSPSFLIFPPLMNWSENPVDGAGVTGTSKSLVRRWNSVTSSVARPLSSVASAPPERTREIEGGADVAADHRAALQRGELLAEQGLVSRLAAPEAQ